MFPVRRTVMTIVAVAATSGVVAGAAGAAGMQGTVRGELGAPLAGATVSLSGPMSAAKRTKADGTYTIQGLVDGAYTVRFSPPAGSPLREEYYDDQPDAAHATPVAVRSGAWTRPIDATLTRPPATITGLVTDERTGDRIKNVVVQATGPSSATAKTGQDGRYTLGGLVPGSYTLRFSPAPGVNYVVEFYDDQPDAAHATPITVGSGATRSADANLSRGAVLTGSVRDSAAQGIGGVGIEVAHGSDPPVGTAVTNTAGSYRIVGIRQAPGDLGVYVARFRKAGYVDEDAPGRYLRAGQTYTTNAVMHRTDELAIVTGQVTKAGGAPLEGAVVTATDTAGVKRFGEATTGPDGRYRLALRGGTYRVRFAGPEGAGRRTGPFGHAGVEHDVHDRPPARHRRHAEGARDRHPGRPAQGCPGRGAAVPEPHVRRVHVHGGGRHVHARPDPARPVLRRARRQPPLPPVVGPPAGLHDRHGAHARVGARR